VWTSLGAYAHHMILLARTDKSGPTKYHGLSFFLAPMGVPNVETTPIRKMTGEHGFTETRFDNARIPSTCLLGDEGQGWMVALTTLAFERGAEGGQAGGQAMVSLRVSQLVELAQTQLRDGKPAIEDPLVRDQLVRFMMEERGLELSQVRMRHAALAQPRPYAVPMMSKLRMSELRRRLCAFAVTLQGANANLYVGDANATADGSWQRGYMNAFSATIGGGTSEIQHNIIGERVLGLPKG
jgi:alkylation response protein AidB-like acyl-CoA dehydrogenase